MKKTLVVPVVLMISVFLTGLGISIDPPDVRSEIKEASGVLMGGSASMEQLVQALTKLIDCASLLSRESENAEEIANQLKIAKNEFQDDSIFSEKGRQKLSFAYRMLTNGEKYRPPQELDDFVTPQEAAEKAGKYAKKLVDQALRNHGAGESLLAARNLVELVLMIVTPIQG